MAAENDVVLIHFEDNPLLFARVESITPDVKPDWFHVKLLLLQIPLQVVTWILRTAYINGNEFTMNGKRMRIERVVSPPDDPPETPPNGPSTDDPTPEKPRSGPGNVIPLSRRRKR